MMTDRELWCFMSKFRQLLCAGKTAKLVIDSRQGCARVNLEVILDPADLHQEQQHHHHYQAHVHRRARGRARERQRARRAKARQEAAQSQTSRSSPPPPSPNVEDEELRTFPSQIVDPPDPDHNPPVEEAALHQSQNNAEEANITDNSPPHTVEEAAQHRAEEVPHHHLPYLVLLSANQYSPTEAVEESAHHPHPHAEEAAHHHPSPLTVEEAAFHQPPTLAERATESFSPPKEFFLPDVATHHVSPVWPAHYCHEDVYSSPHLQVQPQSCYHPPSHPPLSSVSSASQVSPSWPAHTHQQQSQPVGQDQQYAGHGGLVSDQMKKRKKKRKSGRRQGGQPDGCPEAPASSDPAAISQYKDNYEAYFMKEYGEIYTQAKANGQLSHLFDL